MIATDDPAPPSVALAGLRPGTLDRAFAHGVHAAFRHQPGAQHIASEFALAWLSAVLHAVRPRTVLEIGAGIGTVTRALLEHPCRVGRVWSTENDGYCRARLRENLDTRHADRFGLLAPGGEHVPGPCDLVVVDGPFGEGDLGAFGPGTVCFVEGSRTPMRRAIAAHLAASGLACRFHNHHQGIRWLDLRWRRGADGRRRPVFKLWRRRKGCWIGAVTAAD